MTQPGLAYVQPYPGATTCVVVGRFGSPGVPDLDHYRAVLWFADGDATRSPPGGLAPGTLQAVPLEDLDTTRITAMLGQFVQRDARHLPSLFVTDDALRQHTEAYQAVVATACAELDNQHRTRVLRQKDGFAWQKHVLQNLPAYARQRLPASWRGALRGRPAFVCGAGTSLDVSAPELAAHAGRGVVVAADSALRTLARHGVAADIAVSIDAAMTPDRCVPADHPPGRAVVSVASPTAWLGALPHGRVWFAASRQITTAWLADIGLPWPDLAIAEHCSGTALELARYLGCAPIYLFGMDLTLDPGQPAHRQGAEAEPALYSESDSDLDRRLPEVPGNYAEAVPTPLLGDWRTLDARLAGWPAGLIYNVTDRGAWLSNTTLVHPDNFSIPPFAVDKAEMMSRLGPSEPVDAGVLDAAFAQVREVGQRETANVAAIRAALARGGPPAVAAAFRPLFADKALGRVLGTFSLKLMPHLMPPLEGDAAFWGSLVDEYGELLALAQTVR
jgi:hypothetical protein